MCTFLRKGLPVTSKSFEAWPNSNLLIPHLDINIYHLDIGAMNTFSVPVYVPKYYEKAHFQVMGQCPLSFLLNRIH